MEKDVLDSKVYLSELLKELGFKVDNDDCRKYHYHDWNMKYMLVVGVRSIVVNYTLLKDGKEVVNNYVVPIDSASDKFKWVKKFKKRFLKKIKNQK